MTVVTRFAPSPTGFLHIGGARTALFNWLFAHHHGGKYYLRIEDTDLTRSTEAAVQAILDGLNWLGLPWDGDIVYQSKNAAQHVAVAQTMVDHGHAYLCYCTPDEIEDMRAQARANGQQPRYDGRCRHLTTAPTYHDKRKPVIRLKVPQNHNQVVDDLVQGSVTVHNSQLDDMILVRGDGTPTYMLSVVVDDHMMGITHIIRGDDHLTNTFRQKLIYQAMNWQIPQFAHIPLIHGTDGAKLSKRHGALGVDAYQHMGFLPDALCNYLVRLGWSHGNDEIFSRNQAVQWFDLNHVGRAPARFDLQKLLHLNAHYIKSACHDDLIESLQSLNPQPFTDLIKSRLHQGLPSLQQRAKTLLELSDNAQFYIKPRPVVLNEKARILINECPQSYTFLYDVLKSDTVWQAESLERILRQSCAQYDLRLNQVTQFIRACLTGATVSPSIFEIMEIFGYEESMARLQDML